MFAYLFLKPINLLCSSLKSPWGPGTETNGPLKHGEARAMMGIYENKEDTNHKRLFSLQPEAASQAGLEESITSAFLKRMGFQIFLINSFFIMRKVFLFIPKNLSS